MRHPLIGQFGVIDVTGNDSPNLRWSGAEVLANDLAHDRAIICIALHISAAGPEHGPSRAGHPGQNSAGVAVEYAGRVAFLIALHRAAGHEHHTGLGVIGTERSEEHTSELQSHSDLVCRLLLEKKKNKQ